MVTYPAPLKKGATIGIVSPARWPKEEWIAAGKKRLEKAGFKVLVHPQNFMKDGQLAGSDEARASAIMDMFANKSVDAIMCARGGTGAIRVLDKLDYKLIKRNPKPFVGFSDITVLLQAITSKCGFTTFHGPMLWSLAKSTDRRMEEDLFAVLANGGKPLTKKFSGVETIRKGSAEGTLAGGNISLLNSLIGTPYDWSAKGKILFLEDVDEVLYSLDRTLQHFRLAGKFDGVRAVIIGEMVDIKDGETCFVRKGEKPYGRDFRRIVLEAVPPGIPLCFNFPAGHGKYLTTLPVGAKASLKLTAQGATLKLL